MSTSHRLPRLLVATVASLLLVAALLTVNRARVGDVEADIVAAPSPAASPSTGPEGEPTPGPTDATGTDAPGLEALLDPGVAEGLGGEALLALGVATATGPWADLDGPGDWDRGDERPVYVGRVVLGEDRRSVQADLTIATRATGPTDELVLRLLAASEALGPDTNLDVTARRDGVAAPHFVDREGARLLVTLDPPAAAGDAVLVRITVAYDLVDRRVVTDDGGPAGFGLLAWNPEATFLGHWLPVLAVPDNDGALIPWGDVGAFPVALWSLEIEHAGVLTTGGVEDPCLDGSESCTWVRGTLLRDVSAVAFDADAESVSATSADGSEIVVTSPAISRLALNNANVLDETVASMDLFAEEFASLAWPEIDMVAAPMSAGAAGMEFPGLMVIDTDVWNDTNGGFGTFVIVHEVAHQWFHALVGNGSLSDPVVDESLAQYLSFLYWAETYGEESARAFAARNFTGRYDRARGQGLVDEPPAQPLEDFSGDDAYGPLVYARGPMGWVAADQQAGRDVVLDYLREIVDEFALGFVTDDEMLELAYESSELLGSVLERYWFDPRPITPSTAG